MNARALVAVVLMVLAACGGDEEEEQVPSDAPLIEITPIQFKGPLIVKGTLSLPADTRVGVYTVFLLERITAGHEDGFSWSTRC